MSNVEHEHSPDPAPQQPAGQPQGGATTTRPGFSPTLSDDAMDPDEYRKLLDIYDSSFRNIAEGEVVKGTVLKVTDTEVIVDVGF